MPVLAVNGLTKNYPKFKLDGVSFSLENGYIMGFIGRNGSGKTTTLKSMLNIVHADGGTVEMFGKVFKDNELALKQKVGYAFGGADYYQKSRIRTVTDVVRRFYTDWDEKTYNAYCRRFNIDNDKKIGELSEGMKVHYSLALALSHNAELLLLDEPTVGLDPAAHDELLELFQELVEDGKKSVLFSTHITSDLEKCADFITFIEDGELIATDTKDAFVGAYKIVKGTKQQFDIVQKDRLIAYKKNEFGFSALIPASEAGAMNGLNIEAADLESIMIYYARRGNKQ